MGEERGPLASVDAVRAELRRLGYFDSGLDRFLLAGASAGTPLRASGHAALRIGLAGGVVLGVALSLLAVSLEPDIAARPADLALLTLYLALVAGLATALGAWAMGLLASALARRLGRGLGRWLPRLASLAFAVAALLYLGLWWRSHGGDAPPLRQAAFGAIGLAVAFLLGRFGGLASVAVLSAAGLLDRVPEAAVSRRHLLPLLAGAALVFGGSLAMANYLETRAGRPPDYAVVPTGLRVRVVGIDGLELKMVEQMVGRGEMPRLQALLASGAKGALRPEPEQVPAIVWSTIATGRGPEAHGIRAAGARRLPGMAAPVPLPESAWTAALARAAEVVRLTRREPPTAVLRGAKTFWNVASEKGLRVGVVNWWASWPAEPLDGFVVSDRALLRIEKGGPPDREVFPPDDLGRLRPIADALVETDRARRIDRFHAAALLALAQDDPPDLEAVYLNGLDVHTMQRLDPAAADVAVLDASLEEVRAYHRFLDERIGELSHDLGPRQVLVLLGDPGRFARRTARAASGLLLLAGGATRGGALRAAGERDLAPTVLHLLGLPVSAELDGRVLEEALAPAFLARHPVRSVASYGRARRERPAESSFDRDVMEELRSLGYVR